jgi:hypothetical protein
MAAVGTSDDDSGNARPPGNVGRLQSHLPPQSLAAALLKTWDPTELLEKRRERLLQTLISYNTEDAQTDAIPATDKD